MSAPDAFGEYLENEERWLKALEAMILRHDQAPLAQLMGDIYAPIPPGIRERLSQMLDPGTNPQNADRLIYERSDALKRKVKTNEDWIAVGLAVADITAANEAIRKNAVADVAQRIGRTKSYVEKCVADGRRLSDFWKPYARASAIYKKARGTPTAPK